MGGWMFGKSKIVGGQSKPPLPFDGGENPWDVATVAKICQSDKIGFRIRHVETRFRDGAFGPGKEFKCAEHEVIGVGEIDGFPQFVFVEVTFHSQMREFGVVVLDYQYNLVHGGTRVNMPTLKVVLQDAEGHTAKAMHQAVRDALTSGEDGADMRVWTHFDPGWDKRGAVIYGHITGAQVWAELHTPSLPGWAKPIGIGDLSAYPDASRLRAAPPKK